MAQLLPGRSFAVEIRPADHAFDAGRKSSNEIVPPSDNKSMTSPRRHGSAGRQTNSLIKEEMMGVEIKRNGWSRFCKKFNETNQLRHAAVRVKHRDDGEVAIDRGSPFMGIAIAKKGRLIDGVELFTGQSDPDKLTEPLVVVKEPVRITLEKDHNDMDNCLSVEGKDGTVAEVVLSGEKVAGQYHSLIQKLAYSMYERRGFTPGNDVEDWLEAEKKVREVELQFVR